MNRASKIVVNTFLEAAQDWGWEQGSITKLEYESARSKLITRIERIEKQNRKLRKENVDLIFKTIELGGEYP